ncbi:MBL fold metallo-hydrolase [Vannielia litorea]|uniref:Glyoxylase, beta-lactamase superfamily II n=1 Tax=Vannielia litorea TaxID=1217970 RepID=A0A1N6ICF9_9RHOB|nr:MBL fold metallo-hydrolase [Vannielia litorea]SIO29728.1 Glyoxylase, beta-lactamase superfamily II [Vannielia litorea]
MPTGRQVKSAASGSGPVVHGFYEEDTGSWQYICADPATKACAIIDPVLDFDPAHARTSTESAEDLLRCIETNGYELAWILDTHPHADHLTAGHWLAGRTGAPHGIGERCTEIAELWRDYYHMPGAFPIKGDFDRLFADGESFKLGELDVRVMLSTGHTLGSITYVVGDAAFVHDTLMHVDVGTARADFPGGSTEELWRSIQRILDLPDETRLFIGHDYGTDDRDQPECEATVARHRADNPHVGGGRSREAFIALRDARDETLGLPERMLFALQVNLRGGRLPEPEADGHSYYKIPANRF